jgi:hypothetical protein
LHSLQQLFHAHAFRKTPHPRDQGLKLGIRYLFWHNVDLFGAKLHIAPEKTSRISVSRQINPDCAILFGAIYIRGTGIFAFDAPSLSASIRVIRG